MGPLPEWIPELVAGSFRFLPPISGVRQNEWTLHRVTSHEVVVMNTATSEELAIPRRFLGNVRSGVVTLTKRLESSNSRVRPANRDVIVMPSPSGAPRVRSVLPAEVVAIREGEPSVSRSRRLMRALVALGCLACLIVVYVLRDARNSARFRHSSVRPAHPVSHQPALAPLVPPQKK
jgi:hypothetical protein